MTKAGYVAIVGKPNVGKSTLLNSLIGSKLSIVSKRPQTTRKSVLGIYSADDIQIVFLDTPGIMKPKYELHHTLLGYVENSLSEAEAVLVLLDAEALLKSSIERELPSKNVMSLLKESGLPMVCVLNKMDALEEKGAILPTLQKLTEMGMFTRVVAISAINKKFLDDVIDALREHISEREFLYDPQLISTQPTRFFATEFIRESVFLQFREEVPYSTEVQILEFKERSKGKWYIAADVIVERKSQKGILVGNKGEAIKKIGEKARASIEEFTGEEVFLELFVKVREDWRDDPHQLAALGY